MGVHCMDVRVGGYEGVCENMHMCKSMYMCMHGVQIHQPSDLPHTPPSLAHTNTMTHAHTQHSLQWVVLQSMEGGRKDGRRGDNRTGFTIH